MKNKQKLLRVLALFPLLMSAEVFADYSDTGRWSNVIDLDIVPVAVANLPDGKLLTWSAKDKLGFGGTTGKTWTSIFDPQNETSTSTLVSETNHDMFCPGITNLPDGRIMATGGSGNNKTSIYDPSSGVWTAGQEMNTPRGYHGQVTMTDGSVFTVGGSWGSGIGGKNAEVWTAAAGWVPFPLITSNATVRDGAPDPRGEYRDDNHAWLWAAPNGKVLHAGPSSNMHWIDVNGAGGVTNAGSRGSDAYAMNGTIVMYDTGKLLKVGGAPDYGLGVGTDRVQTIDMRTNTAIVTDQASLKFPRTLHHSVVLPTGEVFVVGGMRKARLFYDDDARLTPELWNPSNNTWTSMEPMEVPRTYHSTAILMNDARVFAGGGGLCGNCGDRNHPDAELFSPPYLFVNGTNTLATRPVINSAPATANYSVNVTVKTNSNISSFALVRASSSTHSVNNEQRRLPVTFTGSNNNYSVRMPSRNNAPPGNYMLFAMNAAGTPSIAKTIRLGNESVAQELADGEYWLTSPANGERLTAPSWNGYKAKMLNQSVYGDQKWRINYQGGRVYTIQNVGTGRYMEVENSACSNLAQVSGSTSANANNQRWVISKIGSNYQFRPVNCITKGLDREGGNSFANGVLWNFTANHLNQQWKLDPTGSNSNVAPVGNADSVSISGSDSVIIDPLANDTGAGLSLNAPNVWSFKGGNVALSNNKLTYKPKSGYNGEDKIWYSIVDNQGRSSFGEITITVSGNNVVTDVYPTATADNVNASGSGVITIDALANDIGSGLTLDTPNAWSLNGGNVALVNNKFTYKPKVGYVGTDKIWYTFKDNQNRGNSGEITITVSGSSQGAGVYPTASQDNVTARSGRNTTFDVLANDTGSGLTLSAPNAWSLKGGSVSLVNNQLVYQPKAGFTGSDNIWYVFSDSQGRSNTGQVNIAVTN